MEWKRWSGLEELQSTTELKYCNYHAELSYIPHSEQRRFLVCLLRLPELLVRRAGGVGEVEWFGGAAMNNILFEYLLKCCKHYAHL